MLWIDSDESKYSIKSYANITALLKSDSKEGMHLVLARMTPGDGQDVDNSTMINMRTCLDSTNKSNDELA